MLHAVPAQYVGPPGKPAFPLPPHLSHPLPRHAFMHQQRQLHQQQLQQQQQQQRSQASAGAPVSQGILSPTPPNMSAQHDHPATVAPCASSPTHPVPAVAGPPVNLETCTKAEMAGNIAKQHQAIHVANIEKVENKPTSVDGRESKLGLEASIEKVANPCLNALKQEIGGHVVQSGDTRMDVGKTESVSNKAEPAVSKAEQTEPLPAQSAGLPVSESATKQGHLLHTAQTIPASVQGPSKNAHSSVPSQMDKSTPTDCCISEPNLDVKTVNQTLIVESKGDLCSSQPPSNGTRQNRHSSADKSKDTFKINGRESHVDTSANLAPSHRPQLVNGDACDIPSESQQPIKKSGLDVVPGDGLRLLTAEEIEEEKKKVAQHLLEEHKSGKEVSMLNGLIHPSKIPHQNIGNGDYVVAYARTSDPSLKDNHHIGDGERTNFNKANVEPLPDLTLKHKSNEIVENGYVSPVHSETCAVVAQKDNKLDCAVESIVCNAQPSAQPKGHSMLHSTNQPSLESSISAVIKTASDRSIGMPGQTQPQDSTLHSSLTTSQNPASRDTSQQKTAMESETTPELNSGTPVQSQTLPPITAEGLPGGESGWTTPIVAVSQSIGGKPVSHMLPQQQIADRQQAVMSGGQVQLTTQLPPDQAAQPQVLVVQQQRPQIQMAAQAAPQLPTPQQGSHSPNAVRPVGAATIAELLRLRAERNIADKQQKQQHNHHRPPTPELSGGIPTPAQLQAQLTTATQLQTHVSQPTTPQSANLMSQLQARLQTPPKVQVGPHGPRHQSGIQPIVSTAMRPPHISTSTSVNSAIAAALSLSTHRQPGSMPVHASSSAISPPPVSPSGTAVPSICPASMKRPSSTPGVDAQPKKRKNSCSSSIESRRSSIQSQSGGEFVCEWAGCKK